MLNGNPYNGQQVSGVRVSKAIPTVTLSGGGNFVNDGIPAAQT
jgi:hypothetical protein